MRNKILDRTCKVCWEMREWCCHCPKTTVSPYAEGLHGINGSKIKPSELAACLFVARVQRRQRTKPADIA